MVLLDVVHIPYCKSPDKTYVEWNGMEWTELAVCKGWKFKKSVDFFKE
jgi:hypothetical protein